MLTRIARLRFLLLQDIAAHRVSDLVTYTGTDTGRAARNRIMLAAGYSLWTSHESAAQILRRALRTLHQKGFVDRRVVSTTLGGRAEPGNASWCYSYYITDLGQTELRQQKDRIVQYVLSDPKICSTINSDVFLQMVMYPLKTTTSQI